MGLLNQLRKWAQDVNPDVEPFQVREFGTWEQSTTFTPLQWGIGIECMREYAAPRAWPDRFSIVVTVGPLAVAFVREWGRP